MKLLWMELLPWSILVLQLVQDNRNRCMDIQPNSSPEFFDIFRNFRYSYYLARAVKLSGFKSANAVIFALFIIITIVNTSSELQTVIIDAHVPVLIFFHHLNIEGYLMSRGDSMILTFHLPPLARSQELLAIYSLQSRKIQKKHQKIGMSGRLPGNRISDCHSPRSHQDNSFHKDSLNDI